MRRGASKNQQCLIIGNGRARSQWRLAEYCAVSAQELFILRSFQDWMCVKIGESVTLEILGWFEVGDQIIGIYWWSVTSKFAPLLQERLNLARVVEKHDYSVDIGSNTHQDTFEISFLKGDSLGRGNRVREA